MVELDENEDDEIVDSSDIMWKDPIVGKDDRWVVGDTGSAALAPRPLASPKEPTTAQRELHNLTHLPYCSWCPHCVACRRPNTQHRISHDERTIPLLVGDYGFVRNTQDESLVTLLVMRLYPYGLYFSCVVDVKGPDPVASERLAHFIKSAGLLHFAYRSDKEPAIVALIEDACKRAGRPGGGFQRLLKGLLLNLPL